MPKSTLSAKITELALSKSLIKSKLYSEPDQIQPISKVNAIYTNIFYVRFESEYSTPDRQLLYYIPLQFVSEIEVVLRSKHVVLFECTMADDPDERIQIRKDYLLDQMEKGNVFISNKQSLPKPTW